MPNKKNPTTQNPSFSPRLIGMIADEVAKTVVVRLPHLIANPKKTKKKKPKIIDRAVILDTSAIVDRRIFEVLKLGLVGGTVVVPEEVLVELKNIADSQNTVKRERGRRALEDLEKIKKQKSIKFMVLSEEKSESGNNLVVDEYLIKLTKKHKGILLTCDYNLEKKASIQNVTVVNINALANVLKVTAVPGESVHLKILHQGKESSQGVGYLDDGTMLVVEQGAGLIGYEVDVVVSRVIQTTSGRILFAKRIT